MRNLIATLMIFGVLMSGNTIYAKGTKTLPSEKPANSAHLTFENLEIGTQLFIKNRKGRTLYSEKIKTEGAYSKDLNTIHLPENVYYVEVDEKDAITQIPFDVEQGGITLHYEMEKNISKPELVLDGTSVIFSREVKGSESISIEVYLNGQELVYSEDIERSNSFKRRYDLTQSTTGTYLFDISYDGHVFSEYFQIITMY